MYLADQVCSSIENKLIYIPILVLNIHFSVIKKYYITFISFQIFRDIIPCSIITPLDCFWEGSKLLGPDSGVSIP